MSCYLVQETDGVSRFTLEDGSGFLLLEFCPPPGGVEYNPIGDITPPSQEGRARGRGAEGPMVRGMRRRLQEDEEDLIFLLTEL